MFTTSKHGRAGGIVTYSLSSLNITNCINYGNIEGSGSGIGGILGYTNAGASKEINIENSCNFGSINFIKSGIAYSGAGGIIGLNQISGTQIELNNCFNVGNIEGKGRYNGNLIGNAQSANIQINHCYNITNGLNAIGMGDYTGNVEDKEWEYFMSESFIHVLNQNRGENTLWNKWKLGEDGYPTFEEIDD